MVGLPLLGRPGKRPGGLIKGGLEFYEQPERKASNTSGGNKLKRKPKMAGTYLRLGAEQPKVRLLGALLREARSSPGERGPQGSQRAPDVDLVADE
jgi:hypothetical protein